MNYLVIDLEMCRVPKLYRSKYKYANETIQIGAVLLDDEFKRIATLCQYVHPEYGVIDHFIEKMTGIHNRNIKNAPGIKEALCNSDIEPEGKFHDGLDDAINTGYLIEKLEKYPDFQLLSYAMPETEEHLSCTIGDLFANLQLQAG